MKLTRNNLGKLLVSVPPLSIFLGLLALIICPSSLQQFTILAGTAIAPCSRSMETGGQDQPRKEDKEGSSASAAIAALQTGFQFNGHDLLRPMPLPKQPRTVSPDREGVNPKRWELIATLAQPEYLLVRLLATPTNHRAPPA